MKKILLIITLLVITSCKTSKTSCDAYGSVNHDNNTLSNDTPVVYQKHLTHP
jgi:hypothetical protein